MPSRSRRKDWAKDGIDTYAYDQRGFGETPYHGLWAGDRRMVADLKAAARLLRQREPTCLFYLLGESMGGAVVMAAAVEQGPAAGRRADPGGAGGLEPRRTWGPSPAARSGSSPIRFPGTRWTAAGFASSPPTIAQMLEKLFRDPLIIKATRIDTVYGLVGLMDRAWAAHPDMPARTLVLYRRP